MVLHFLTADARAAGAGDAVELTGPEAHHAVAVRRVRVGEPVTVGDGAGVWLTGVVEHAAAKRLVVRVEERREVPEPGRRVLLAQALAKGDRDERAVQAAVELGVDGILPWQASRSVSRWDAAKAAKGVARWEAIAREAVKQAHRPWLPAVSAPLATADLVARASAGACLLVLEPTASVALSHLEVPATGDIVLVVGPEGGIAPEELDLLTAAGAVAVRLGDTVLRTSTAGPAALALVNVALGRW